MEIPWMKAVIIESLAIGIGYGGWASKTAFWTGSASVAAGMAAAGLAFIVLAIIRDAEEQRYKKRYKRGAKPSYEWNKNALNL